MTQTIEAIYKDGGFEIFGEISLGLEEGERVTLVIKAADHVEETRISLSEKYFAGLSEEYIDKVITHALAKAKQGFSS